MGTDSGIEWTTHTLNFWVGCTKLGIDCQNCYAEREMKRYGRNFDHVTRTSKQIWRQPIAKNRAGEYKWKAGDKVFVESWGDFFHKSAFIWRQEAWDVMMQRSDLTWIIPTKRTKEAQKWFEQHKCPDNVWLLASVGHESTTHRIPELLAIDAPVRGLSMEPLLGPVDVKLNRWVCSQCGDWTEGPILDDDNHCKCDYYVEERLKNQLDWVIIGCESGPNRRPCKLEWVRDLIEQCDAAGVAVFVKQLSIKGRVSKDPAEWPIWARRREMP